MDTPRKLEMPCKEGIFSLTITCAKWLHLIEKVNGYDIIYKWFDYLKSNGHYICGYVIMPNHIHVMICLHRHVPSERRGWGNVKHRGANFEYMFKCNDFTIDAVKNAMLGMYQRNAKQIFMQNPEWFKSATLNLTFEKAGLTSAAITKDNFIIYLNKIIETNDQVEINKLFGFVKNL